MHGARAIIDKLMLVQDQVCESLDISQNALGDDGAVEVARLLCSNLPTLQSINLSLNDIGDQGAAVLAEAMEQNTTLRTFVFQSGVDGSRTTPKITDAGISRLASALHSHPTISSVDLRGAGASALVQRALVALARSNRGIMELNGASSAAFLAKHEG